MVKAGGELRLLPHQILFQYLLKWYLKNTILNNFTLVLLLASNR